MWITAYNNYLLFFANIEQSSLTKKKLLKVFFGFLWADFLCVSLKIVSFHLQIIFGLILWVFLLTLEVICPLIHLFCYLFLQVTFHSQLHFFPVNDHLWFFTLMLYYSFYFLLPPSTNSFSFHWCQGIYTLHSFLTQIYKLLVYEKFLLKFRYFKIELLNFAFDGFLRHKLQIFILNHGLCDTVRIFFPSSFPSVGCYKPVHVFVT